jgi:hypothetical protein
MAIRAIKNIGRYKSLNTIRIKLLQNRTASGFGLAPAGVLADFSWPEFSVSGLHE